MPDALPRLIREFVDTEGKNQFRDWLDSLDLSAKARVQARDIKRAKDYWTAYQEEHDGGT